MCSKLQIHVKSMCKESLLHRWHAKDMQHLSTSSLKQIFKTIEDINSKQSLDHACFPSHLGINVCFPGELRQNFTLCWIVTMSHKRNIHYISSYLVLDEQCYCQIASKPHKIVTNWTFIKATPKPFVLSFCN